MSCKSNKTDEEDEDDYMSDKILNQIADTRPGLVFNRVTARKYEIEKNTEIKNKQNRQLSRQELEDLKRKEALEKSTLKPDNVGFNLMLKMGYKAGETLGKSNKNERDETKKSYLEPIPIEIKTDREGLGQSSERKEKLLEIEKLRENLKAKKREHEQVCEKSYLNFKRGKFNLRKLRYNLHKCQRICYQLDSTKGLLMPEILWYWPFNIIQALKEEKHKNEPKIETKLSVDSKKNESLYTESELKEDLSKRTDYKEKLLQKPEKPKVNLQKLYDERLKSFLETKEEGENSVELKQHDEHESEEEEDFFLDRDYNEQVRLEKAKNEGEELSDINEDEYEEENEELLAKKVDSICLYLREKYLYCVWCATTFSNQDDMSLNCPGLSEKEHEDENENE